MFDLGSWGELLIIVMAALVLLGPKELPKVLRTLGRGLHHLRRMTRDVRQTFSHYIHEGEFEEYTRTRKPVEGIPPESVKRTKAPRAALATRVAQPGASTMVSSKTPPKPSALKSSVVKSSKRTVKRP